MSELKAYDMSRFQRIIGNDGDRVQGTWQALHTGSHGTEVLVWPVDVRVYADAEHSWAQGISRGDFSARITDGVVDLRPSDVQESKRAICQDSWDELVAVLQTVAATMLEAIKESPNV